MQHIDWNDIAQQLDHAGDRLAALSRCLQVGPELGSWRAGDEVAGMSAADALDQARGDLERILSGEGAVLLELVRRVLDELPLPME